ncbi:MAG: sugar phosphate isomerase/epimerase family protein [Candidatus Hodarchaeota archaeon]
MVKSPIALQLYSIRGDCTRNLPGTLKAVKQMGYEGVEFAGHYGRTARELRDLLDTLELSPVGSHTNIYSLLGDELRRTIEFNRELGNKLLIVPSLPEEMRRSKEAWLKTASLFNEISEKVRREGMYIGFHNHAIEFQPLEGILPWDLFFETTISDIIMQLDIGNAMQGGISSDGILEILRRFPDRAITIHLKEFSSTNDHALIGEGEVKWKELLFLCECLGVIEWYIIEQESYAYAPLVCAQRCIENLKEIREMPFLDE